MQKTKNKNKKLQESGSPAHTESTESQDPFFLKVVLQNRPHNDNKSDWGDLSAEPWGPSSGSNTG